ncbi:hypothetical protein Ancab_032039 [Ancistrocladus abbreviatus]
MGAVSLQLLVSVFASLTASAETANVIVSSDSDAPKTLSKKSFPEGFVFGRTTSAYQVKGMALKDGRGWSIWEPFVQVPASLIDEGWKLRKELEKLMKVEESLLQQKSRGTWL